MGKLTTLSVLSVFTSFSLVAKQPSFNYIETGFITLDDPNIGYELDGYKLKGMIQISKNLFISAEYKSASDKKMQQMLPRSNESTYTMAGIGYKSRVKSQLSFYTRVAHINFNYDNIGSGILNNNVVTTRDKSSANGYLAGLGFKSLVTRQTELYWELAHLNIESISQTQMTLGTRQKMNKTMAIYTEYEANDFGSEEFSIGLSINF